MDVFTLSHDDGAIYSLTEREYLEKTRRDPPYAAKTHRGTTLYLAVCPDCKNPIEIRNIGSAAGINRENAKHPFGQHYRGSIADLPAIKDTVAYEQCSLRGVPSISSSATRKNEDLSNHILVFLVNNAAAVRDILADIYGVAVGPTLFERCVKYFVERGAYRCQGVRMNNLPYSLAYWADSQSLFRQAVKEKSPIHSFAATLQFYALCNNRIEPGAETEKAKSKYKSDIKVHCLPRNPISADADTRLGQMEVRYVEYGAVKRGRVLYTGTLTYNLDHFLTHAEAILAKTDEGTIARCAKWKNHALVAIKDASPTLYAKLSFVCPLSSEK